jgi:hypothetical protein
MPAKFIMFLGVGEQDHANQSRQDTSGCDIPRHVPFPRCALSDCAGR